MSDQVANQFIEALRTLEETKDAGPLAALYTDDAVVGNIITPDQYQGPDGAKTFWTEYRSTFETAKSTFRTVTAGGSSAALEWTTEGTSFAGASFSYSGVTILEIADDKISRSSAYFDPAALGRQMGVK